MFKFIIFLLCFLFSFSAITETVYKTTKPDGSVEFTDRESTDSEEVKVRKPTTYTAPRLPALDLPVKKLSPAFNYSLNITQPAEDSTIVGKHDVKVSIKISPNLNWNHQIRYQLGMKSIVSDKNTETFKNVNRGTHNLSVSIIDSDGELVSPVVSRTFHMKRFFKKPPAKPKVP